MEATMKYNIRYEKRDSEGVCLYVVQAEEQNAKLDVTLPVNLLDAEFYVADVVADDDEVCEVGVCFSGAEFKEDVRKTRLFIDA